MAQKAGVFDNSTDIADQLGFSLAQVRRLYGALVARLRMRLSGERR